MRSGQPRILGSALAVAAGAVAALAIAPAAGAAPASKACAGQGVPISAANLLSSERTLLCLLNVYRDDNGLRSLTLDPHLSSAARLHTADMVARGYFGHRAPRPAPNGPMPTDRAIRAGYPAGDSTVGENLAADPNAPTPLSMFDQWRMSSAHNSNMLHRPYETVGIGLAPGAAGIAATGATGAQVFGMREGAGSYRAKDLIGGDPGTHAGPSAGSGSGPGSRRKRAGADACTRATRAVEGAKRSAERSRRQVSRAGTRLRRAGGGRGEARARTRVARERSRLRARREALREARGAKRRACSRRP